MDRKGQEPRTSSRSDGVERNMRFSITENQIWVIREVKIKAKGNSRKRPSSVKRKNEN